MRLIFVLAVALFSINAMAGSPLMTVKERLRILLWVEGIQETQPKASAQKAPRLPEEIEKPLRNL